MSEQIGREIMWSIPYSFTIVMYVTLALATVVFFWGVVRKYRFVSQGESLKPLFASGLNWKNFLNTIFFQGKVTRVRRVAIFHSLIFYGFLILWIATDLVAIHYDTPFKIFKGPLYLGISLIADLAGLAILLGVGLAFYRRYIQRPDYLSSTNPKQELFMYAMLISLVVIGYLMEGIRILATDFPIHEQVWSPIGYWLGLALNQIPMSDFQWATGYRWIWLFHMLNTMVFVGSLSWSKFLHIFSLPLAALITPFYRGGVLLPMNFENEEAETFGLGKASELSMKERWDTLTCVECGRCTNVCPAYLAGKPLNPKTIITKARDAIHAEANAQNLQQKDVDFWENPLYGDAELDSCTTCGACMEECPSNIEHVPMIMDLKRYKALTLGKLPPEAATAVGNIQKNGNPWGISQDDRMKWAEGKDIPVADEAKAIDYLYYVGCAGSYDSSNQKVLLDTIGLFKQAGVDFAVMGKTEKCNGDPIRRFGDEYSFQEIAIENISQIRKYQFKKIVTHCPHCLHTIGKEYKKFDKGDFEVLHHTELLADLLTSGRLVPKKSIPEELTFHDPCYLGRHHGEYDAPRTILNAIPDLKLKEMEKNKDKSLCCGMGGGNMWYEIPEGKHIAENRLQQIGETTKKKLATSCSFCLINFNSAKARVASTEELEVEDVAQILARSTLVDS